MSKAILDVCCGGRMFYKNKQDERVLKSGGTLIFKWAETDIKLSEILKCFSQKPLITQNTANKSHWCVFFK